VGIYVGKLRFVNAPSTGGTVRLDYLTNPYWAKRFDGIRRVAPPVARPTPFDGPTYLASPTPTPDDATGRSANVKAAPSALSNTVATENVPHNANRPLAPVPAPVTADSADAARTADTADAFEPPPSAAALAARQAHQAGARPVQADTLPLGVVVERSSRASPAQPALTSTIDDPIARFAEGAQ
jgi:hypothetical protein